MNSHQASKSVVRYTGPCTVLALIRPDVQENFKWCCVVLDQKKRTPTYTEFKKIRLRRDMFSVNSRTLRKDIFIRAILVHYAYQLDDAQLLPLF